MKLTAKEVYDKLVNEFKIKEQIGEIKFTLGDLTINVTTSDVVGNIMQQWVKEWLIKNGVEAEENPNTQAAPDFFLDLDNRQKGWMEVKAFHGSPNFDIADFAPYGNELPDKPWCLDEDFLIFKYKMDSKTGVITIVDIWLKKVWEICGTSANYAINVQAKAPDKSNPKQKNIHKIRPITWYTTRKNTYKPFKSLEYFLSAMAYLRLSDYRTFMDSTWLIRVKKAYRDYFGKDLSIPNFNEIPTEELKRI